jgi:hypothetical protein
MSTLQNDIDVFIPKAQRKIASLGEDMLAKDKNNLCIDFEISLIQELFSGIRLLESTACDCLTRNDKYKIIHHLSYKANLTIVPVGAYLNTDPTTIIIPSPSFNNGPQGDKGNNGWSGVYAVVTDGSRRVLQLVDWTGGQGSKPSTGFYLSSTGFTSDISLAEDIRGAVGATGSTGANGSAGANGTNGTNGTNGSDGADGADGFDGWSAIYSIISDGTRRVLQVSAWTGGGGTPPDTGDYLGVTGFVTDIADAVDIRGESGLKGDPFTINAMGDLSNRNTYDDEGTGFTYLAEDTGDVYIKSSPLTGDWGPPVSFVGQKGWSPSLNTVEDGDRIVLQVSDWFGGQGTKPDSGEYLGPLGFTSDISQATNIRGLTGEFIINAASDLSDRPTFDGEARPFVFYAVDDGKIYFKNSNVSGDWTPGYDWRGERGPDGPAGTAGTNAFTFTSASFVQPSVNSNVTITVINTSWISVGQILYIENGGYYSVVSVPGTSSLTIKNLGYAGNASPSSTIPSVSKISPSGIPGAGDITNGGNSFTDDIEIGTNDAFDLIFKTDNTTQATLDTDGLFTIKKIEINGTEDTGTPDAAIRINRILSANLASGHGFRDQTDFRQDTYSYCAFDAASTIGLNSFGHIIGFQSRIAANDGPGSEIISIGAYEAVNGGTTQDMYGFVSAPTVFGGFGGKIGNNRYGARIYDVGGAGAIDGTNYGIYIDSLTRGTTDDWAIYTAGSTKSYFGGEIQIGNTVNSVSPTSPNRTITMVIGGTTYYLHAKTTND